MKNKFLLMSVVSALFALVVVPSAMAQDSLTDSQDITARITSGDFYITAVGQFTSSIDFSLATPPVTDVSTTFSTTAANDYFHFVDGTNDPGGLVSIYLDRDFVYSDTTDMDSATQDAIPATNLEFGAAYEAAPTVSTTGTPTALVLTASTSADAETITLYTFKGEGAGTDYYDAGRGYADNAESLTHEPYFASTATGPMAVNIGLEKLNLTVPAGYVAGKYNNIVHVLIEDGNDTGL